MFVSAEGDPIGNGISLVSAIGHDAPGDAPPLRRMTVRVATGLAIAAPRALRMAYCGAHSRSLSSRSYVRTLAAGDIESGWWVGAWSGTDGPSLVMGATSVRSFATEVRVEAQSITATQHLEHLRLAKGEEVALETIWIAAQDCPPLEALEVFAEHLGATHGVRLDVAPCGWGSWGHWLERIDMGLMRESVRALDGLPSLRNALRVVQIDDGWSEMLESGRVSSSWRPNRRFPSGIAPLAAEIRRSGRECGLWLLPFTVNSGSAIAEQHPDWLVRDVTDAPFRVGGADTFCIDPTHPEASRWLRHLFGQMRDWGVRYVKLDHLRALVASEPCEGLDTFDVPRRHYGARTRIEAYRAGLTLVREAMGDAVFIVGCSAPAAPGTGLVSAHRVGPDIEAKWSGHLSGVQEAARALITNWFWHGRAWLNDPDYLLLCESEAVSRFWATVVAMSGGSMIISSDLAHLRPWEERILRIVTPPAGGPARPIDLFSHPLAPGILHQTLSRSGTTRQYVALLNWDDQPRIARLDLASIGVHEHAHVFDVWRGSHRHVRHEEIAVPLDGHDASLLCIRKSEDHPQVVGSDIHWTQGWLELSDEQWDPNTSTLSISIDVSAPRTGHLWISHSPRLRPCTECNRKAPGLFAVEVHPGARLSLRFTRVENESRFE